MITAQDIREKTFEKARFSGYDMASVDDFLEELAEDVTATQKENAVLKSKMKVLVDKIEEYRANEDALNMAVLSAQKLAVQIENDARARASAMLAEATSRSRRRSAPSPSRPPRRRSVWRTPRPLPRSSSTAYVPCATPSSRISTPSAAA